MKLQEVLLRAMEKKITWMAASSGGHRGQFTYDAALAEQIRVAESIESLR